MALVHIDNIDLEPRERRYLLIQRAKELLSELPAQEYRPGQRPPWNDNRPSAFSVASQLGGSFDTNCPDCDWDVWYFLTQQTK